MTPDPAGLAALNADLAAAFGPGRVVAQRVLQVSERAVVAEAVSGPETVVVKQFLGADRAETIARMQAEHDAIGPHMAAGRFRLAVWQAVSAPHGLAVLHKAPGQRLDVVLARAGAVERAAILALVGGWLAAFTVPRRHLAPMNLHSVIRRRKGAAPADLSPGDSALTGAALSRLRGLARDLTGVALVQSGIHGDLTPYNLTLAAAPDGIDVWAFDLQATRNRPVALDAAHFLVIAGLRLPLAKPGPLQGGLPQADRDALLAACPDAQGAVLDFFVGDRLLRALHEASVPARAEAARHALQGWLA